MTRGWVEMARDDVVETMDAWHALKEQRPPIVSTTSVLTDDRIEAMRKAWLPTAGLDRGGDPLDPTMVAVIDKLLGSVIMLLRAVEEIEARPWWKPRRYNPYAR